jgi:hypothetical protein
MRTPYPTHCVEWAILQTTLEINGFLTTAYPPTFHSDRFAKRGQAWPKSSIISHRPPGRSQSIRRNVLRRQPRRTWSSILPAQSARITPSTLFSTPVVTLACASIAQRFACQLDQTSHMLYLQNLEDIKADVQSVGGRSRRYARSFWVEPECVCECSAENVWGGRWPIMLYSLSSL